MSAYDYEEYSYPDDYDIDDIGPADNYTFPAGSGAGETPWDEFNGSWDPITEEQREYEAEEDAAYILYCQSQGVTDVAFTNLATGDTFSTETVTDRALEAVVKPLSFTFMVITLPRRFLPVLTAMISTIG